jgi:hypothetical protein
MKELISNPILTKEKKNNKYFLRKIKTIKKLKILETQKDTQSLPISIENNKTKKIINEEFEKMDIKGWEYAFKTKEEYNLFADILTCFFQQKDYNVPKTPIKLKGRCKTKLAAALGKIHSLLGFVDKFTSDIEYFKIIKSLNHYSNISNDELYRSLTRNRKDD